MKSQLPAIVIALFAMPFSHLNAQTDVNSTTYPGLFGPVDSVKVPIPIIGVGETVSNSLGTYWNAEASGGFGIVGITGTSPQVQLTGNSLQFNLTTDPATLLGALNTGVSVSLQWSAVAKFNKSNSVFTLRPNSRYRVIFDLDTGAGLLRSTLGLSSQFQVSLLDATGSPVGSASGGNTINLLGLQLLPTGSSTTGRAVVTFKTGNSEPPAGAAQLKFNASTTLPAKLVGIGTNFATVTNLSVSRVSSFVAYLEDNGITDSSLQLPDVDSDHDGRSNLGEYALGTDPSKGDGENIHFSVLNQNVSGTPSGTAIITVPIRAESDFEDDGEHLSATAEGVSYSIEGSYDLMNWNEKVVEIKPNDSFTTGLPTVPLGWEYRTFRLVNQTPSTSKAFMRVRYSSN